MSEEYVSGAIIRSVLDPFFKDMSGQYLDPMLNYIEGLAKVQVKRLPSEVGEATSIVILIGHDAPNDVKRMCEDMTVGYHHKSRCGNWFIRSQNVEHAHILSIAIAESWASIKPVNGAHNV